MSHIPETIDRIRNLTPHPIRITDPDYVGLTGYDGPPETVVVFQPDPDGPARAAVCADEYRWGVLHIAGKRPWAACELIIQAQRYGEPIGLPDPAEGTWLIVSTITGDAARAAGRPLHDLLVPGGEMARYGGHPYSVEYLALYDAASPLPRERKIPTPLEQLRAAYLAGCRVGVLGTVDVEYPVPTYRSADEISSDHDLIVAASSVSAEEIRQAEEWGLVLQVL